MENFNQFIADLNELVRINSIQEKPIKDCPFGLGPKLALDKFLEIANRMGFKTTNYQNYIGEISVGSGEEIGIIGHLDIVPAGTGWETDPFTLVEKDGYFYGRGTSDDKGPTLITLYALKAVVDSGVKFNKTIKFYAGTNEETGWKDIDYFNENYAFPEYGFSPDGNFPVIYAEKGMYRLDFYLPKLKNFTEIQGGSAINAVCGNCKVKPLKKFDNYADFNLTFDGEYLYSQGVQAHGSTPHLGKNAILPMLKFMQSCGEEVDRVIEFFFDDKFGIFQMQNEQGNVTFSPNLIVEKGDNIILSCDCRIPAPFTLEEVSKKFDKFGFKYTVESHSHPPMMVEKDGWFVNTLINAYNSVTGENRAPMSMGGSTFARAFKYGCAFGASFPEEKGMAHQANECVSKESFLKMFEIYKKAIYDLVK